MCTGKKWFLPGFGLFSPDPVRLWNSKTKEVSRMSFFCTSKLSYAMLCYFVCFIKYVCILFVFVLLVFVLPLFCFGWLLSWLVAFACICFCFFFLLFWSITKHLILIIDWTHADWSLYKFGDRVCRMVISSDSPMMTFSQVCWRLLVPMSARHILHARNKPKRTARRSKAKKRILWA